MCKSRLREEGEREMEYMHTTPIVSRPFNTPLCMQAYPAVAEVGGSSPWVAWGDVPSQTK